ncbi:family 43 glycosylhydrolase [Streptomyces sp. NPDC093085]|uniref:glycoside hydrolase family 43 protein n=1 Tax=Streptomyces sp. NPDC093085 TaxID=3155068 RepID=UPI003418FA77
MSRPWTADLGDGRYRNPVLNADWSDPDAIRVGDDYYLTASSFGRVPGLPLLHSRDLVNWSLVGHALERLDPAEEFAVPQPGRGVWAPALRHHDGRFWIFWGDPDRGVCQVNSPSIEGPWTTPHLLKAGRGLIDACPLWDEESGEAYLVHAWAKSRSGVKNRLTGHRMSPDGRELLDAGRTVVDGDLLPGWFTLEGPKLYRRDGWYWILAPAGSVATGWQGAFRAREFFGPYEERVVLAQGRTEVNGPHQGAWVTGAAGDEWFLHFQDRGAYGRVVHLQPLRRDEAGWPVVGAGGEPVTVHPKPALPAHVAPPEVRAPATDDDFPGGGFGPQWQWAANPVPGQALPGDGDGLRLACRRTPDAHDLRLLPGALVQRLPAESFTVTVELALEGCGPGDETGVGPGEGAGGHEGDGTGAKAGLAVLGDTFTWIGLERGADGTVALVHRFMEVGGSHERDAAPPRPAPDGRAALRFEVTPGARCWFAADTGDGFRASGQPYAAAPWGWCGAQVALFATAPPRGGAGAGTGDGTPEGPAGAAGTAGTAVFTTFRATDLPPRPAPPAPAPPA